MKKSTYGSRLGELVRNKRRIMGLTQIQLSEDAFGVPNKVRRISDLENGVVENPHPKTVDPIITVLKISEAELADCLQDNSLNPDLDRAYREARNLIDALAYQFEHRNPDASLAELDEFLRAKATEWRKLRTRLDEIDALNAAFTEEKIRASDALAEGILGDVDSILADLEEQYQQKRTLAVVTKQSELRIARADACMIGDNLDAAFEHYKKGAKFLEPFDQLQAVRLLQENAQRIYEGSRRSFAPRYGVGIKLMEEALQIDIAASQPELCAELSYQLSLLCRNAIRLAGSGDRADLANSALKHARRSERYSIDAGNIYEIAASKVSVANCLLELGKQNDRLENLKEAIATLKSAKNIALKEEEAESLLSHICNSLGGSLMAASHQADGDRFPEIVAEAIDEFTIAVENAQKYYNYETWGAAKGNLGGALDALADRFEAEDPKRIFVLIRSLSEYLASLETYPQTLFPDHFAEMQARLGGTLFKLAKAVQDERAELYMVRSITSYEAASAIFEDGEPVRWADCQTMLASVIASHGASNLAQDPRADFKEAICRLAAAQAVYVERDDKDAADECRRNIKLLNTEMEEIDQA